MKSDGSTDERFERGCIDLFTVMDVNLAPCVALKAGVEEFGRVLQRSPLGESQRHDCLVGLAGANDPLQHLIGFQKRRHLAIARSAKGIVLIYALALLA